MKDKLKLLLGIVVLVTALTLCGLYLYGSNTENRLMMELSRVEKQLAAGEELDLAEAAAVLQGKDEESAMKALSASAASDDGERIPVLTAVLSAQMAQSGALPEASATTIVTDVLARLPISSKWEKPLQDALPELLACLSPEELATVLTAADIASSDTALQDRLGDLAKGRLTLPQLAEVYRDRLAAKKPADRLAMRALSGRTQEDVVAALAEETDMERRAALAKAYGKTLSLPNDVLAYLADARAAGIPAAECYPTGAQVTWDLSQLAPVGFARKPQGDAPRYLIVRLTESEEKFEYRDVPTDLEMDEWYYDGAFSLVYESNAGRWMETVTVRIDTEAMDLIPAEYIPGDLSEMDALVVLDTHYEACGTLRVRSYRVKRATGGRWTDSYRDYRNYYVVQRLDVYDRQGRLVYCFDEQVTEPVTPENRSDGFSDDLSQTELKAACIPVPDSVWMRERREWLLEELRACGGDLWRTIQTIEKE